MHARNARSRHVHSPCEAIPPANHRYGSSHSMPCAHLERRRSPCGPLPCPRAACLCVRALARTSPSPPPHCCQSGSPTADHTRAAAIDAPRVAPRERVASRSIAAVAVAVATQIATAVTTAVAAAIAMQVAAVAARQEMLALQSRLCKRGDAANRGARGNRRQGLQRLPSRAPRQSGHRECLQTSRHAERRQRDRGMREINKAW